MHQNCAKQVNSLVVLCSLGMVIIVALLLFVPLKPPWPKVLECLFYLLCLHLLVTYPPIRVVLDALSPVLRWAMLGLAGVLVIAQIRERPTQTFPFLPWNMYQGRFTEPPEYLEYIGICPDGREVNIPVCQVFLSQPHTVLWKLQLLWKQMHSATENISSTRHAEQFRSLLFAVVSRFKYQHPETDITRVRVIQCNLPRPVPGLKLDVKRHVLAEYPIS